jgi:hypothetical protein
MTGDRQGLSLPFVLHGNKSLTRIDAFGAASGETVSLGPSVSCVV